MKDCERAKLVRSVIGPNIKLMFDFNTSCSYFGGVSHAIKFMRELEKFDAFWFEDPLLMDDIQGMREVSTAIDTAIAAGECEQTLWGFRDLIVNRAVDILLPDATQMCGEITQWKKIAVLAETFHVPVAAHIVKHGGASIAAAECADGIPEHGSYGSLLKNAESHDLLLAQLRAPGFCRDDMWQAHIHALICQKAGIYVFSDGLSDEQVGSAMCQSCSCIEATVAELLKKNGREAKVCVLPEGSQTISQVLEK